MSERRLDTRDNIDENIHEISLDAHFLQLQMRRAEAEIHWFVSSPGALVGSISPHSDEIANHDSRYMTLKKLRGSQRKLNAGTLIATQSFTLPKDMSEKGMRRFFEEWKQSPETSRHLGYVGLNEPGFPLIQPIKTDISSFIETKATGSELAAQGIDHYLNDSADFDAQRATITEEIQAAYAHLAAHEDERYETTMRAIMKAFRKN